MPEPGPNPHEGLSKEDDQKAAESYAQHERTGHRLDHAQRVLEEREATWRTTPDGGSIAGPFKPGEGIAEARLAVDQAQDSYDIGTMRDKAHLDAHLGEYQEQAKLDAEADGKAIDLEGTKVEGETDLAESIASLIESGREDTERVEAFRTAVDGLITKFNQNPDNRKADSSGFGGAIGEFEPNSSRGVGSFRIEGYSVEFIALVKGEYDHLQGTEEWLESADGFEVFVGRPGEDPEYETYVYAVNGRKRAGQVVPSIIHGHDELEKVTALLRAVETAEPLEHPYYD